MTPPLLQYSPETEVYDAAALPRPALHDGAEATRSAFGEDAVLELAAALLEAHGGAGQVRVLDALLARAGQRLRSFVRRPAGG